jgi:type IV pilus assembly protein PilB
VEERKRIGELLLEAGVITPEQLQEALAEQQTHGGRLCYNLIRLGFLRADDLVGFLRDQFGVAAVNLERYQVPPAVLALIPAAFARARRVVPLHVLGETLTVAMVDPSRVEDVRAIREMTGLEPDPVISPEASLEAALRRFYPAAERSAAAPEGILALGDETEARHLYLPAPPPEGYTAEDWLRRFVLQAVKRRSREIHLEPTEDGLLARYRVRGGLQEGESAPTPVRDEITLRALELAGVSADGQRIAPAEGRFRIHIRSRWLRATLSSFPTLHGERLLVKIIDESLLSREFQELGMSKEVADEMQRLLAFRHGVILINAPPGQGKMTSFYSLLAYLKGEGGRNIMTLESPVRFPIPGINQTQVGGRSGLDFADGLQSLLHQEPDVVGLTDVPDRKALEMVFGAARRCLVVALCGFRDAAQCLDWIRDGGVSQATVGLLLRGVLSQRLLPKVCSSCREPLAEPVRLLEGLRDKQVEDLVFYTGNGCEQCGFTGRTGKVALFELLSFRGEVRDLLHRGDPFQVVCEEAQRQGMWTLREDGVMKASQGLVDIREVIEATAGEGSAHE